MALLMFIYAYSISVFPEPVIKDEKVLPTYKAPFYVESKEKRKIVEEFYCVGAQDSLWIDILLPPDSFYVIKFDPVKISLEDTLAPTYNLPEGAEEVIESAPVWLRNDLIENFINMGWDAAEKCIEIIQQNNDPRILDELYFQIAHLAPQVLAVIDPEVIIDNAKYLYEIDEDLKYVDIVDHGDPQTDSSYYSTTKYRVINENQDTVWVEIPKEIYYWWVVMPKGTDEMPRKDASVYNKFWREYLYYSDEEYDYTSGGTYPLLKDVVANVKVYWDGTKHVWRGDREYSDTMSLVNALGWWITRIVPEKAWGNRPIQPNVIAYEHNGNCGELQDLAWAAGRTVLIPILGTLDINEDHVWNAIYWPLDSNWYEFQVDLGGGSTHVADSGTAYDVDRGGSKQVSCVWNWRGDGYQWSCVDIYSNVCTLTVKVFDKNGVPYPSYTVKLLSEGWYTTMLWKGFSGITDRNGEFTTILGDQQNYYILGKGKVIDSAEALPGTHFFYYDTLTLELPVSVPKDEKQEGEKGYRIQVDVEVPYEIGHGLSFSYEDYTYGGSQTFAKKFENGILEYFYIMDAENLLKFRNGYKFYYLHKDTGFTVLKKEYDVPTDKNVYIVFYNSNPKLSVVVKGWVKAYSAAGGIAEKKDKFEKSLFLTFYSRKDKVILDTGEQVEIYDISGRRIKKFENVINMAELSPGVYFAKIKNQGIVKKFIVLR